MSKKEKSDETIRIAAFFDGRPGHEKQTSGILVALERLACVEISEIRVKSRFSGALRAIFEFIKLERQLRVSGRSFDMAIGTGSKTHSCILAAKFFSGAIVVVCMSPEKILLPFFDLCLAPFHDNIPDLPCVFRTAGPPGINACKCIHEKSSGLVLIGGIDAKSHFWDSDEICEMTEKIISGMPSVKWTVSASPRTPLSMNENLEKLARKTGSLFFPFSSTPRGWLEKMYDSCMTVWVTADSISMIYEALSAGCRVGVIPVKWKKKDNKFSRSIESLKNRNLVAFYPETPDMYEKTDGFDEASRCAAEIIQIWKKGLK